MTLSAADTDLAQYCRETAQAAKAEHELQVLTGKYIARDEVEIELAGRAVILSNSLRHLAQKKSADIIDLVKGDLAVQGELIEFLTALFDRLLNEYASNKEFQVEFNLTKHR
mgnify:CR=1 FL=1